MKWLLAWIPRESAMVQPFSDSRSGGKEQGCPASFGCSPKERNLLVQHGKERVPRFPQNRFSSRKRQRNRSDSSHEYLLKSALKKNQKSNLSPWCFTYRSISNESHSRRFRSFSSNGGALGPSAGKAVPFAGETGCSTPAIMLFACSGTTTEPTRLSV